VIRAAIRDKGMAGIARIVMARRERMILLEPLDQRLAGTTLHAADEDKVFNEISEIKYPKEMKDLAAHIIDGRAGHFAPEQFDDRYEEAVAELLKSKQAGKPVKGDEEPAKSSNVVNVTVALKCSISAKKAGFADKKAAASPRKFAVKTMSAKSLPPRRRRVGPVEPPDKLYCVGECDGRRIVGDASQDSSVPSQSRHQAKGLRFSRRLPGEARFLDHERAEGNPWDEAKTFTADVAAMTKASPVLYTDSMAKRARAGWIFIDYLRNGRGATAVVYRPQFLRHRIEAYAASAANESCLYRTALGVRKPCRAISQVEL
jgi:hypothetical protein